MSLDTIRSEVQESKSYYILSAQDEFESSTNINPKVIEEELAYKKHIFSKLKFLYLEQETRDKFLRRISEISSDELEQLNASDELKNIEQETIDSKVILKELKNTMNERISDLQQLCTTNMDLYNEYTTKNNQTQEVIHHIDQLNTDIDGLLNEFEDKELIDQLSTQETSEDSNIESIRNSKQSMVNDERTRMQDLDTELELSRSTLKSHEQSIQQLQAKLDELQQVADKYTQDHEPQAQVHNQRLVDKYQNYAKWCKEMNDILVRLTGIDDVKLKLTNKNNFCLVIQQTKRIIYTRDWKIINMDGFNDCQPFINRVNVLTLSEDQFLQKLAEYVRSYTSK
ncbi:uncharacterized protein RJT21DRAFT_117071 [Scheffersomyces amazonensis]|uniref:uncharacterized protein n=1 Tax=Scheffersomyces amazonensis TaxID=1078765 RepID=UPI00315DDABD